MTLCIANSLSIFIALYSRKEELNSFLFTCQQFLDQHDQITTAMDLSQLPTCPEQIEFGREFLGVK